MVNTKINVDLADFLYRIVDDIKMKSKDTIHIDLKGNLDIINKSEGKRIIAGYASIAVVDSEDQIIPTEVLKKGVDSLLADPHYANVMLVHKNIQIGKIIESYSKYKTGVDDKGLFIVCEIRKDIKTADEIWESILNGDLNGFSIGCEVLLSHDECDENKCINILDEINIFEVSVCSQPINKGSGFIVISKSKYEDIPIDRKTNYKNYMINPDGDFIIWNIYGDYDE